MISTQSYSMPRMIQVQLFLCLNYSRHEKCFAQHFPVTIIICQSESYTEKCRSRKSCIQNDLGTTFLVPRSFQANTAMPRSFQAQIILGIGQHCAQIILDICLASCQDHSRHILVLCLDYSRHKKCFAQHFLVTIIICQSKSYTEKSLGSGKVVSRMIQVQFFLCLDHSRQKELCLDHSRHRIGLCLDHSRIVPRSFQAFSLCAQFVPRLFSVTKFLYLELSQHFPNRNRNSMFPAPRHLMLE